MKHIKVEYDNPNNVDMSKPGFFNLRFQKSVITETEITFIYKVIKNRDRKWKIKKGK